MFIVSNRLLLFLFQHLNIAPVHPSLSAKQQLVSSAAGTQATMECKVEASPRSVNYWVKLGQGPGAQEMPINPGGRVRLVDIDENSYTQRMVLTIENVKSRDFGTYACVTRNSLGEVRRTVQLQGNWNIYIDFLFDAFLTLPVAKCIQNHIEIVL